MDKSLRLTVKDLQYLMNSLDKTIATFGNCEEHLDDDGFCLICTALQRIDTFISESYEGNAGFWYNLDGDEDIDW